MTPTVQIFQVFDAFQRVWGTEGREFEWLPPEVEQPTIF